MASLPVANGIPGAPLAPESARLAKMRIAATMSDIGRPSTGNATAIPVPDQRPAAAMRPLTTLLQTVLQSAAPLFRPAPPTAAEAGVASRTEPSADADGTVAPMQAAAAIQNQTAHPGQSGQPPLHFAPYQAPAPLTAAATGPDGVQRQEPRAELVPPGGPAREAEALPILPIVLVAAAFFALFCLIVFI